MAIKDTLRSLMTARGVSGYALSESTKIPQPTIHRILTGESSDPKTATLEPIAKFFNLTVSQLREGAIPHASTKVAGYRVVQSDVPVFTWDQLTQPDREPKRYEAVQAPLEPTVYAVEVTNDLMDNGVDGIPKGYLVFADPALPPKPNTIVIGLDPKSGSAVLRKLVVDGGRWYLRALNPQYQVTVEVEASPTSILAIVTAAQPPMVWFK